MNPQPLWRALSALLLGALSLGALSLGALALSACDDNSAPALLPLQEQVWRVNAAQSLEVFASDPDGDALTFSFTLTPTPAPRESAAGAPALTPLSGSSALFQWAPLSSDAGSYTLTLRARDPSGASAEESVSLVVREEGGGGATQLVFESPQGAGVSVEVDPDGGPACLSDLEVLVKADAVPDSEVFVRLEDPSPAGVALLPPAEVAGKRRALSWCPSSGDLLAQGRFVLSLYAYRAGDEDHGVRKQLLVRFARPNGANCPGRAPSIEHTPAEEVTGVADYVIRAQVLDDVGVKSPPLLAYLINPRVDPRVELVDGWGLVEFEPDGQAPPSQSAAELLVSSSWRAAIPNPNLAEGQTALIYYRVIATDNDDPSGALCDQTTESPIYLTRAVGGGAGGALPLCAPCTHSGQCGGAADLCVSYEEGTFCGVACDPMTGAACPAEADCYELTTSSNELVYQCIPRSGTCAGRCEPDAFETPDEQATTLEPGRYTDLSICDEQVDFYWLPLGADDGLEVAVSFTDASLDLDLAVALRADDMGNPLYEYESASPSSTTERVTLPCAGGAAGALVAVYPYQPASGAYALELRRLEGGCAAGCVEDPYESPSPAPIPADIIEGLQVCPGNPDAFSFSVDAGQVISLLVTWRGALGALEVALYGPDGRLVAERLERRDGALIEARAERAGAYRIEVRGATPLVSNSYSIDLWVFDAAACGATRECAASEFCAPDLGCLDAACAAGATCAGDHSCVSPALDDAADGQCRALCYGREQCRAGEECKPLPSLSKACLPEGRAGLGERCADHADCVGAYACAMAGSGFSGVCMDMACDATLPCPLGLTCAPQPTGYPVCAPSCESGGRCPGLLRCERQASGAQLCVP